jgi:16S rRNA (guanine1207-N2)-methyltransferase
LCATAAADPTLHLLAEYALPQDGDHLLILGAGCGLLAAWATNRAVLGRLVLSDTHSAALDRAAATLQRNRRVAYELLPLAQLGELDAQCFDIILVDIAVQSNSKALSAALLAAGRALKAGGRIYVAGAKTQGIGAVKRQVAELFGAAGTLGYRKGVHVFAATRPAAWEAAGYSLAGEEQPETVDIALRGQAVRLALRDGVFARGGLDDGTRLLLETLDVRPTDRALDLGCGGGIVGLLLARLAPLGHVDLVDSDLAAVALARANLQANGITNAAVYAGDGFHALPGTRYELIVTNPPFHIGRRQTSAVARAFIAGAARALRDGGRFYVVANRFLAYERDMLAAFGDVREIAGDGRYKVLLALQPLQLA